MEEGERKKEVVISQNVMALFELSRIEVESSFKLNTVQSTFRYSENVVALIKGGGSSRSNGKLTVLYIILRIQPKILVPGIYIDMR